MASFHAPVRPHDTRDSFPSPKFITERVTLHITFRFNKLNIQPEKHLELARMLGQTRRDLGSLLELTVEEYDRIMQVTAELLCS